MKIRDKKAITSGSKRVNEDAFGICEHGAWVLDGSSGLTKTHITGSGSDTKWFVDRWNDYLYRNINKKVSLQEIMHEGIVHIGSNFRELQGEIKLEYIDFPSLAISIIRFGDRCIEYFTLGDCCILYSNNGTIQQVFDDRVSMLDKRVVEKMKYLHKTRNISISDARDLCTEDLKNNRYLKNSSEGYWIIGMEGEAVYHALSGNITVDNEIGICIATDGFSQYYDTLGLAQNKEEFFMKVQNTSAEDLLFQLRKAQESDEFCDEYPRLKKSDDATLVYLKLEK